MEAPSLTLAVTALRLTGVTTESQQLRVLVDTLVKQAKKKDVAAAEATLRLSDALTLKLEVQDRGARIKVEGHGIYACSIAGVLDALADVIREDHGADPQLLDLYQRLLEAT